VCGIVKSLTTSVTDDWRRAATSDSTIRCVRCLLVLAADHEDSDETVLSGEFVTSSSTLSAATRTTLVSLMSTLIGSLCAQLRVVDDSAETRARLMRRVRFALKYVSENDDHVGRCLRHDLLDGCTESDERAWLATVCASGTIDVVVGTVARLADEHGHRRHDVENGARAPANSVSFSLNKSSILHTSNRQTTTSAFLYGDRSRPSSRTLDQSTFAKTIAGQSTTSVDEERLRLLKTCLSFVGALMCNEKALAPLVEANFSFVTTLNLRPAVTPPG